MKTKLPQTMKTLKLLAVAAVALVCLAGSRETEPIHFPGSLYTWVYDTNQRGQTTGCYYYEEGYDPETGWLIQHLNGFLYYKGEYTSIEVPGAKFTIPAGIKGNGEVYGVYSDPEWSLDWEHTFTWRKGRFPLTP